MIRSMTGFGGAQTQVDGIHYALEVRSLNSKYFRAQVRLPEELQGIEAELETALARRLNRGTAVVTVRVSDTSAEAATPINTKAAQRYLDQLLTLRGTDHPAVRIDLASVLALPGVMVSESPADRLEREKSVLLELLGEASTKLIAMRVREGETLLGDLKRHCSTIAERLAFVAERLPRIIELYQDKLRTRMVSLLEGTGAAVRDEDLLREVAIFAERSDIAEEVDRLQGHLAQFGELLDQNDNEPRGRTLDFIAQEMLREANTIGSKCLDSEVARHIVDVKGAIDRIKEQVQNVE
jgi:uncharacterized protein (TIGR00255 family)